jgi:hypothetical protein
MATPSRLYGVDFSGAKDAGAKIWLAEGALTPEGVTVSRLFQARDLPGSGLGVELAMPALRRFVASQRGAAFGFDFPFAVTDAATGAQPWLSFVTGFLGRYPDAEAFRAACRAATGGKEIKRETDKVARVPFNAFNLRCYRQTYRGLAELVAPLVVSGEAVALPMQPPALDAPWLLEICPASTLKRGDLYRDSYKGLTAEHRFARARILEAIAARERLVITDPTLAELAIANPGGDALDALIALGATARAVRHPFAMEPECEAVHRTEGYIYV